jgi:large subunit ribosomal protein L23
MKEILIKPLITEKMSADTERNNSYGFVVALCANKIEIKKAIEKEYNVALLFRLLYEYDQFQQ